MNPMLGVGLGSASQPDVLLGELHHDFEYDVYLERLVE